MSDTRQILLDALAHIEANRPRTQQVEVGPSSVGGCRPQVVMKLMGLDPINPTEQLPSIMGTAIHAAIENALAAQGHQHIELEVPGIPGLLGPGHIDFYQPDSKTITDWKTTKKSNLRYFPKAQQIWQVQLYGYLAIKAGYAVDIVELVAIARDGTSRDIKVHAETYDENKALAAIEWLEERNAEAEAGVIPAPEMKAAYFCRDYCQFYGPSLCLGL